MPQVTVRTDVNRKNQSFIILQSKDDNGALGCIQFDCTPGRVERAFPGANRRATQRRTYLARLMRDSMFYHQIPGPSLMIHTALVCQSKRYCAGPVVSTAAGCAECISRKFLSIPKPS
jgi:hypothetical protein